MKNFIIVVMVLCLALLVHADEAEKFCNDAQTWEYFDSVVKKSPDDISLQILHALKIGLCVKIEQGSITTSEAIYLFNDMVDTAANKSGEGKNENKEL